MQDRIFIYTTLYLLVGILLSTNSKAQVLNKLSDPIHHNEMKPELDTLDNIKENIHFNRLIASEDTMKHFHIYCMGKDFSKAKPKLSIELADTLIIQGKREEYPRAIISGYNLKGIIYTYFDDYVKAVNNLKNAISIGDKYLDNSEISINDKYGCTLYYLGDLYYKKGDFETSLDYYKKSYDIFNQFDKENLKKEDSLFKATGIAFTTIREDRAYAAYSIGKSLLALNKIDTSFVYLQESLNSLKKAPHESLKARIYYSLSEYHLKKRDTINALNYIKTSLDMTEFMGMYEFAVYNYINLLKLNKESSDFYYVNDLYCRALDRSERMSMKKEEAKIHEIYSDFLYNIGRVDEAYEILKKSTTIRNELFNEENARKFGQLEAGLKYQKQLYDLELAALQSKEEEKRLETRLYFTFAIIILMLIIAGIIFYSLRKNKQQNRELTYLNKELELSKSRLEELNLTKDKLFRIISHDLKNPILEFDKGTSYLLKKAENNDVKTLPADLKKLNRSANNINNLLYSLLDWANEQFNEENIKFEKVDLNDSIEDVLKLYENQIEEKQLKVEKDIQFSEVNSDKNICNTIIRNIIHNSIKFTDKNGKIKISSYKEDDFTILEIEDNGKGIEKTDLERIRNSQRPVLKSVLSNSEGTGFGLLTVHENIEKIKGNIFIESSPGKGTIVTVYFPGG